jgi:hypothetical protein
MIKVQKYQLNWKQYVNRPQDSRLPKSAKGKVKLSPCLISYKRLCYEMGYSSTILDCGTFTPLPLYFRGKSTRHPLDRRLGGPQSQSERCGVERNLVLAGIGAGSSSSRPVAIPTPYQNQHIYTILKKWRAVRSAEVDREISFKTREYRNGFTAINPRDGKRKRRPQHRVRDLSVSCVKRICT